MRLGSATSAVLALAVAVVPAGCGGGDEEGEFRERANSICAEYDERIEALGTPADLAALEGTSAQIADLIEEGTGRLRELEAPGDLDAAYGDWLDLNDEAAANARELSAAAGDDDRARVFELAGLAQQNTGESNALAETLGLDECAIGEPTAR